MIIEQRICTLKPGKTAAYLSLYQERGLAVQTEHLGRLVGYFTSENGDLNQITHLWAFDDHADRAGALPFLRTDAGSRWSRFSTA